MVRPSSIISSLGLVVIAQADKATHTASQTASANAIATDLDFVVPEPVSAPGVNTSSGCGKKLSSDLEIGDTSGPFTFDTTDKYGREYSIYIPTYYDVNKASPLIFGLPGNTNTYKDIEKQTDLSDASMNPYAIAVFVSGVNLGFVSNPGYGDTEDATYPKVDDLGFMNDFIDDLTDRFCIDTGRIMAVGHSNGGGLTNVMACDPVLSTRISVFAANSGAFYTNYTDGHPDSVKTGTTVQDECSPGRKPIPYIEFHGTDDSVVDYKGADDHSSYGIRVLPDIRHWASSWAVRNGFSSDTVTSRPDDDVTVYQWGGGVVTHYRLSGWVHDYARKSAGAPIDATPIIMQFFYNQTNFTADERPNTTPTSSATPTGTTAPSSTSSAAGGRGPAIAGSSLLAVGMIFSLLF